MKRDKDYKCRLYSIFNDNKFVCKNRCVLTLTSLLIELSNDNGTSDRESERENRVDGAEKNWSESETAEPKLTKQYRKIKREKKIIIEMPWWNKKEKKAEK